METVWITGASSGIGEACAYRWAQDGARLVITAPTAEELEPVAAKCREIGSPGVAVLPYDLSRPDGIPDLTKAAWEAFGNLDTVYLNAGISQRTSVEASILQIINDCGCELYGSMIIGYYDFRHVLLLSGQRGRGDLYHVRYVAD